MEEDKNIEQNLDNSNDKLHISDVRQRFIDVLESRLNKLKLDRKSYSNSFKGRISPTYTPTAHIYYRSLDVRINELELMIGDMENVV
jgi:hypothetical protein